MVRTLLVGGAPLDRLQPQRLIQQLVHPIRRLADARDVVGAVLLGQAVGPPLEQLGEARDDGQRRAQVVDQVRQAVVVAGQRRGRGGAQSAMSPRSSAMAVAWTRLRARSLRITVRTCVRAVSAETPRP